MLVINNRHRDPSPATGETYQTPYHGQNGQLHIGAVGSDLGVGAGAGRESVDSENARSPTVINVAFSDCGCRLTATIC